MALTATIHTFAIELADSDRQVYESLALRVARHPSESEEYLLTRVLAYALEFTEGIEFSRGLSEPDQPAIRVRDLTGAIRAWIDVGTPDAERLHKACKAAPRVAVYTPRDPAQLIGRLAGERIHRAATLELYALDRGLVRAVAARLERRMAFTLSVSDRQLYLSVGADTLAGGVSRFAWKSETRAFLPS
ncbi:MAG: YaeQ family protein [Candidatus Rokuibacteriota bacterium]